LPEAHKCKELKRSWDQYRKERRKRIEPIKPIREPPVWVPLPVGRESKKFDMDEYRERYKGYRRQRRRAMAKSAAKWIAGFAILGIIVWGVITYGPYILEAIEGVTPEGEGGGSYPTPPSEPEPELEPTSPLPLNYYVAAENYVARNYAPVGEKNIGNLANFLDQIVLRAYVEGMFDCSETSAMLEWLLEGAGFDTSLAKGYTVMGDHTWVLVNLGEEGLVAIEATFLTESNLHSPGIIETPEGYFERYSYKYEMFLEWKEEYPPRQYAYDPNITFEEWESEYLKEPLFGTISSSTYYNPSDVYASPADAMETTGLSYIPKSEWDWWSVSPYNSMEPFSEW
jgi:hypothetical protein